MRQQRSRLWAVLLMMGVFGLSACTNAATPTPTPPPTPLPTSTPTPAPESHVFTVDDGASTIDYLATGAFGIQLPGNFSLLGNAVSLVADGDGFRVKIDVLIDGDSVTAVNGLVRDALRGSLEVTKFPTGHFIAVSKEVIKPGADALTVTVSGTLELHGQSKAVQMDITLTVKDGKLTGIGQTDVDLLDYGVNVPTAILNSKVTFKATIIGNEAGSAMETPAATSAASF